MDHRRHPGNGYVHDIEVIKHLDTGLQHPRRLGKIRTVHAYHAWDIVALSPPRIRYRAQIIIRESDRVDSNALRSCIRCGRHACSGLHNAGYAIVIESILRFVHLSCSKEKHLLIHRWCVKMHEVSGVRPGSSLNRALFHLIKGIIKETALCIRTAVLLRVQPFSQVAVRPAHLICIDVLIIQYTVHNLICHQQEAVLRRVVTGG